MFFLGPWGFSGGARPERSPLNERAKTWFLPLAVNHKKWGPQIFENACKACIFKDLGYIDQGKQEGLQEGEAKGLQRGVTQGLKKAAEHLIQKGFPVHQVAQLLELSPESLTPPIEITAP